MSESEFIFPPGFPEEIADHLRGAQARMEMGRRDYQNRVRELLDTLHPEHLVTLRDMLVTTQGDDNAAPYLQGLIGGTLIHKHGVCISCGTMHDEADHTTSPPDVSVVGGTDNGGTSGGEQLQLPFDENAPDEAPADDTAWYFASLEEYNLRLPNEGEVHATSDEKPVICKGCGTLYQSLEDRMLRKPQADGCGGCVQKAKWG